MKLHSLIVAAAGAMTLFSARAQPVYFFDSDNSSGNGFGGGGIQSAWNGTRAGWFNGTANVVWSDGAVAVFAGDTNGTANVFGTSPPFNPAPNSIVFSNVSGYVISGATARRLIVQAGDIYCHTDASITVNITNAPADITTGIRKWGPARLTLPSNNGFFGGLYVFEGTLALPDKQPIGGADQPLIINGGTVEFTTVQNVSGRVLYIGDNGATINVVGSADSWLWQKMQSTNGTLTKIGQGTFIAGGTNIWSRPSPLVINEGIFRADITAGAGIGTGAVTVNTNGTLGGLGFVGGPVTATGTISPGATAVGNLTLQNGLDLSGGGTNKWELTAFKDDSDGVAGTDFDRVSITDGNLKLGGLSKLSLNFIGAAAPPDGGDPFWQADHTWTVVALSGAASNSPASNFGSLLNASYTAGNFSTSVSGNGSILLTFTTSTAPPPPAPHIETIVNASLTNVVLTWTSVSNYNYQVQYNTNLATTNWSVLTNLTATGSPTAIADPAGAETQRYYRVVLQLP